MGDKSLVLAVVKRVWSSVPGGSGYIRSNSTHVDKVAFKIINTIYGIEFDPAAAVHRQATFALKMSQYAWLESPDFVELVSHAQVRYERFFQLIAKNIGAVVPALDIDLVWHTHQLSPIRYNEFCKRITGGRFINHDDTIAKDELQVGADKSALLYRQLFNEDYYLCHSWYCEARRHHGMEADYDAIQALIEMGRTRRTKLGLSNDMSRAVCMCHNCMRVNIGADCESQCQSCRLSRGSRTDEVCGSECSGSCGSDCGSRTDEVSCSGCNGSCGSSCGSRTDTALAMSNCTPTSCGSSSCGSRCTTGGCKSS